MQQSFERTAYPFSGHDGRKTLSFFKTILHAVSVSCSYDHKSYDHVKGLVGGIIIQPSLSKLAECQYRAQVDAPQSKAQQIEKLKDTTRKAERRPWLL
jgi:hypothetical protein